MPESKPELKSGSMPESQPDTKPNSKPNSRLNAKPDSKQDSTRELSLSSSSDSSETHAALTQNHLATSPKGGLSGSVAGSAVRDTARSAEPELPIAAPLIYPSLNWFAYDLREALGDRRAQTDQRRFRFWSKIYSPLPSDKLHELASYESRAKANKLLDQETEPLPSLDGWLYPVQLEDLYGLQAENSGAWQDETHQRDLTPQPVRTIADRRAQLTRLLNRGFSADDRRIVPDRRGNVGETWLLWAQLSDTDLDMDAIAAECYAQLNPGGNFKGDLQQFGTFQGGAFYDLWQVPEVLPEDWHDFCEDHPHVCLWLFPAGEDLATIQQRVLSQSLNLLRWFAYRNKINWSFWQSQRLKATLKNTYAKLKHNYRTLYAQIKADQYDLNDLRDQLADLTLQQSDYSETLVLIDAQQRTLEINVENYKKRQDLLQRCASLELVNAISRTWFPDLYAQQIARDRGNLSQGQTILENLVRTLEGAIQLTQTRSEQALNQTLGLASVGLATSGVAVTIATNTQPVDAKPKNPVQISAQILSDPAFLMSLMFGALGATIGWFSWRAWRFWRKQRSPQ